MFATPCKTIGTPYNTTVATLKTITHLKTITLAEAAKRQGVTPERIRVLCAQRRIPGARLTGKVWRVSVQFTITPGTRGPALSARRRPKK
jgi:hypothetical protein